MENLNAEKVKKALECYSEKPLISECEKGCVYYEKYNGFSTCCLPIEEVIIKNALALINSQEQRIKELTVENEAWQKQLISQEEKSSKAYYDIACEVENLRAENERLKSVEFTCGFVKPHKVLECPIFDEIERTKADTVSELQARVAVRYGTYTDKDMTPITEVFRLLDQIAKEILEEK
jgi:hypothetical protein